VNPNEYAAQQAYISAQILSYVTGIGRFFTRPALPTKDWLNLLSLIFPHIVQARQQSAALGRTFYDSQRAQELPHLTRNDRPLEGTDFQTFVKNMEPARAKMSQPEAPKDALARFGLQAVREVENAGRQQIIHAVENDTPLIDAQKAEPEEKVIRGWARVATGAYTCAWCLMLVSRGPVYLGADTAGLDLSDHEAQKMIAAGTDVGPHMQQWHAGCDCKVIPVFKSQGWFGEDAAKRALTQWNDATREANKIQDEDPTVHPSGKNKGKEMTLNQEALNALRRRLKNGDITMAEFSALAA